MADVMSQNLFQKVMDQNNAAQGQRPQADAGAPIGGQNADHNTSGIFLGNSLERATSWRVQRGSGQGPNPATLGRGNIFPAQSSTTAPPPAAGAM